jgi:hypothetical protein
LKEVVTMGIDAWGKLWDLAVGEPGAPAKIEVQADDPGFVTLIWPDGSCGSYEWYGGEWQAIEPLSTVPCDVAARDTF